MINRRNPISEHGFSLVELMVVVSIIGIISSIATPNIRIALLRARQAEAKTNLASLYKMEKIFKKEYGQFFGDFRNLGFVVEGTLLYRIGFVTGGGPDVLLPTYVGPGVAPGATAVQVNTNLFCAGSPGCTENGQTACALDPLHDVTNNAFLAAAVGRALDACDAWSITEDGRLLNQLIQ